MDVNPMPRLAKQILLPPVIENIVPGAALPGGDVEVHGIHLGPSLPSTPGVLVDGISANVLMSRNARLGFRVPQQATAGLVEERTPHGTSNTLSLHIARELSDGLH